MPIEPVDLIIPFLGKKWDINSKKEFEEPKAYIKVEDEQPSTVVLTRNEYVLDIYA